MSTFLIGVLSFFTYLFIMLPILLVTFFWGQAKYQSHKDIWYLKFNKHNNLVSTFIGLVITFVGLYLLTNNMVTLYVPLAMFVINFIFTKLSSKLFRSLFKSRWVIKDKKSLHKDFVAIEKVLIYKESYFKKMKDKELLNINRTLQKNLAVINGYYSIYDNTELFDRAISGKYSYEYNIVKSAILSNEHNATRFDRNKLLNYLDFSELVIDELKDIASHEENHIDFDRLMSQLELIKEIKNK